MLTAEYVNDTAKTLQQPDPAARSGGRGAAAVACVRLPAWFRDEVAYQAIPGPAGRRSERLRARC